MLNVLPAQRLMAESHRLVDERLPEQFAGELHRFTSEDSFRSGHFSLGQRHVADFAGKLRRAVLVPLRVPLAPPDSHYLEASSGRAGPAEGTPCAA